MRRQVDSSHTGFVGNKIVSMAWGPMVGMHGGNERVALESLDRGDIVKVINPKTGKTEYAMSTTERTLPYYIDKHICTKIVYNA
jgi:hypothetical protein